MKKDQVVVGGKYVAKVSGKLTTVKLLCASPYGGWRAINTDTGREIRIRTAARLRSVAIALTIAICLCGCAGSLPVPGDCDGDGWVTRTEYGRLVAGAIDCPSADLNRDGQIDRDEMIFATDSIVWQHRCPPPGDCNEDGVVSQEEVYRAHDIADGVVQYLSCIAADTDANGSVDGIDVTLITLGHDYPALRVCR